MWGSGPHVRTGCAAYRLPSTTSHRPREPDMAIEFRGVSKRYGDLVALDRVSFTAAAGRVTGFVGRNGAGKTTALRILLGLVRADDGWATVNRRPVAALPVGRVGVLLEPTFHPARTGWA